MNSKICFLTTNRNLNTGSYRIWINDLNEWLNMAGQDSKIASSVSHPDVVASDVVICSKGDVPMALEAKKMFPDKKIGIINLSADHRDLPIDFVIVGSIEEKDSLAHYENVFLFPLVEKMFQGQETKKHVDKSRLLIGYHGNLMHLSKFKPGLQSALESVSREMDITLRIVVSDPKFSWSIGRPNVENIEFVKWNLATIKENLFECDIGVVPNLTNLKYDMQFKNSTKEGLYNTDYVLRFKNKSNAGRAFVFHQLGIPVVADITPSNLHIFGNPDCGFAVCSEEGWRKALLKLKDTKTRQFIADNAKREFDRLYDPQRWTKRLYNEIMEIK